MKNKPNSLMRFFALFKNQKKLLITAIITTIISIIISIFIPFKTGKTIDLIIENIKIKTQNNKTKEIINNFKPFIKEIETINIEAINLINKDATTADLVSYGLISNDSLSILDKDTTKSLLNTKVTNLETINCYDCNEEDYTYTINNIYNITNQDKSITFIENNHSQIIKNIVIILLCIILNFTSYYLINYMMSKLSKEITYNLREKINKKIFLVPISYYTNKTQGDTSSLITNDIDNISACIATDIIDIINSILLFIGLLITMFSISIKLTLIILSIIPIVFGLLFIIIIISSKQFKIKQNQLGTYNDYILNSYNNYKIIHSYNKKEMFAKKEENLNTKLYESTWKSNFFSNLMQPIVSFSGNINFFIVCVFGGLLVINGKITLGTLQAFLNYARDFNGPLINIASSIGIIEEAIASTNRIYDFLETKEEKILPSKPLDFQKQIIFKNVSFGYTNKQVLNNISFSIKKGEKVAIVGETGSGKTTLIKLLLGFYNNYKGNIKIDNQELKNINKTKLRNLIDVVLQDSWVFNGSILDNINYGKNYDIKQITEACQLAELDSIISKLPNNYNFIYDNTKNNLSKGEKQLITIARSFLNQKEVIILDEATSNIDVKTEENIKNAVNKLTKNKTTIFIAHRLSTIIKSDKIIVMKNGNIVECGPHKTLMKNKGYYYELYNSQYK